MRKTVLSILLLFVVRLIVQYDMSNSETKDNGSEFPKSIVIIGKDESSSGPDYSMELIDKGEFTYGIEKSKRDSILKKLSTPLLPLFDFEMPQQQKSLPAYYIDKYEVTNEQYEKFMKATDRK